MTKFRLTIVLAVAALLIAVGCFGLVVRALRPTAHSTYSEVDPSVRIGGPFTLTDQNGRPATEALLKGKWSAVFFGYTRCPDVCPLTLQNLGATQKLLGDKAKDLQIVFVTVDPARDTPSDLKAYVTSGGFPTGVVALTGTQAQIDAAEKAYRISVSKVPSGDGYIYSHTSIIYLMDPKGAFATPLTKDMTPQQNADQIQAAMSGE